MSDVVLITLIVVVAILIVFFMFRDRLSGAKGKVRGGGYEAEGEMTMGAGAAVDKPPAKPDSPAIQVEDAKAGRDLEAKDKAGGGVVAKRLEAGQDIRLSSSAGEAAPKA